MFEMEYQWLTTHYMYMAYYFKKACKRARNDKCQTVLCWIVVPQSHYVYSCKKIIQLCTRVLAVKTIKLVAHWEYASIIS